MEYSTDKMSFSIIVDPINKLIRYKHKGLINREDIGEAWTIFLSKKEFTEQKYNLLSDYRDSKFCGEVKDIGIILDFLSSIKDILNGKKQALILDDPLSTALSMIFENKVNKQIGFNVKIFSTQEEALKWLKI